ncbi:MAG: hypothetical protein K9K93_04945 [Acholeplasmataceae bacterium]|nr:hypothetical protein [Acholeplasmataceae bacterium]
MNTKIIIYSKTGNTLSVAERLSEAINAPIERVEAEDDNPNISHPVLTVTPAVDADHIVFASPVHGFQLAQIMRCYLEGLPDLSGKTVDLFITHAFPFCWMGGHMALRQMKKLVVKKNGKIKKVTCINWSRKREKTINDMIGG